MRSALLFLLLFSTLLSNAQVNLTQGLVAYYPFNGNTGDSSGNANHVTVNNNATLTSDRFGNANSAYLFNGTNSYMKVPNSTSLNITTGSISMCAWVKVNGFNYGACHGNRMMYKSDVDAGTGAWGIDFGDNLYTNGQNCSNPIPDTLHETYYSNGAGNGNPPYVQKNKWTFVVITYDGPSATAKLYVNGVLVASSVIAGSGFSNAYDLYFGKLNSGSGVYFLNAAMDDIRIYNRAINQSEVTALATTGNTQVSLTQGLVAYYPFNGNTGDSSGNANHVTVNNNATLTTDRFGNANSAYLFNGTNSYMKVPTSTSLNITTGSISMCAWVKVNGFNYGACHGNRMMYKSDIDAGTGAWGIDFGDNLYTNGQNCSNPIPDTLHENFYSNGAGNGNPPYVQKNKWTFVVITYDGPSTTAKLYINGVLVASNVIAGSGFSNAYDLYFGKLNSGSGIYFLNAAMDDIRIYNRAINQNEINALATTGSTQVTQTSLTQGLVAWYKFDSNTADSSGNGNHVTVNNNATLTTDRFGNPNSAYSFNGVNSYMKVPVSTTLNITTDNISICTWVKVNGFNYGACHGNCILYKSDINIGSGNYGIQFGDIKGGQNCSSPLPDTLHETFYGQATLGNYPSNIQKNTWYFVVSTYDGTTARTYVNGQLVDSITTVVPTFSNIYDLYIGKFNSSGGIYWLNATLDDTRIYDRAINQTEINALYTPATTTLPVDLVAFTATKDKKDVDLNWQVSSEINHDYYEVERSFDAANFTSIAKVNGIYNNSGGSYTYTDINVLSLTTSAEIYYRLKMVSKTGDVAYSNVVPISTGSTISTVSTYPNPFLDHVVLNLTSQKSGPTGITITDMSGKIVSTQTINVPQGNTTININGLGNLAKGLYMLRITNADTVITQKLLKGE